LDYGKNYSQARDGFVYIYSPDANSAYETADQIVLARAPKSRLRERATYEFFSGFDASGQPQWAHDLARRQAVFTHAGHCYRPRVTYDAPIRRYLLVQPIADSASKDTHGRLDTRFHGGLAIYDAPEPWGPWTTVFYTERWDAGPGDSASFPSKSISEDGTTLRLVFSGGDSFSVRQVSLAVKK
jgi:hypothetical protein